MCESPAFESGERERKRERERERAPIDSVLLLD
jgi:hypothetical protein